MPQALQQYSLSAALVQQLFGLLGELPARLSRGLLNELERQCAEQERAAAPPAPGTA